MRGISAADEMLFVMVTRISRAIRFLRQGRLDSPIRADARRIMPDGIASDVPYYSVDFDFRLAHL